jgi:LCP family protein required for cell wall assembly
VANPASGNGSRDKLSHCGLGGIDNCVGAMNGLYGLDIEYYARINFAGFRKLVDAIGGVTVHSEISFSSGPYYFRQGENHLNGEEALVFARERMVLAGGDNDRGKNQMRLITGMIQQLSMDNLIANYAQILESLEGMFATNFPAESIGKLVQLQLTEKPSWDILTFAVTGGNGNDMCWAVGGYGYVMYPHEHMVAHAVQMMERFLQGEVLTEEDLVPQQ